MVGGLPTRTTSIEMTQTRESLEMTFVDTLSQNQEMHLLQWVALLMSQGEVFQLGTAVIVQSFLGSALLTWTSPDQGSIRRLLRWKETRLRGKERSLMKPLEADYEAGGGACFHHSSTELSRI